MDTLVLVYKWRMLPHILHSPFSLTSLPQTKPPCTVPFTCLAASSLATDTCAFTNRLAHLIHIYVLHCRTPCTASPTCQDCSSAVSKKSRMGRAWLSVCGSPAHGTRMERHGAAWSCMELGMEPHGAAWGQHEAAWGRMLLLGVA